MTKHLNHPQEQNRKDVPPASTGNKERQARSRLNITHPVRWDDSELEETYNVRRKHQNKKSALTELHDSDR